MKKTKKFRPPVKTHGGKWYLAPWIIENFPNEFEQMTYVEPMCAGASVFLNKNSSDHEVINDLDTGLVCVFKSLRDEPKEFIDRLKRITYSERVFNTALKRSQDKFEDYIEHAINEYVLRRMSRGGLKKAFAWSERKRGGKPGDVNAWKTMIQELPSVSDRLKKTTILNKSIFEIFNIFDEENTLWYIDPPYMPETREKNSKNVYEYEMTADDHVNLLNLIKNARGKVIISGYSCPLYNRTLKGWKIKKKTVSNNAGQGKIKEKRTECLWLNY